MDFDNGFGNDFLFNGMFNFVGIMVPLMFLIIFAIIIITVVKNISQWNKNNHSPRLTVKAKVVSKRTSVSGGTHHMNDMHNVHDVHTTYFVTFEVESGDRMELLVKGNDYGLMVEGDEGNLTFQGTRFIDFVRNVI